MNNDKDRQADEDHADNGSSRRGFFTSGMGLTAAALASGSLKVQAQDADGVKRAQAREGYTTPLPRNWVADHVTDDVHPPIKEMPPPLTANVNAANPLEYELFLSLNSASGYLMLDRLLALNNEYHVTMNFRPILPRVLLNGQEGEFPYTFNYENIESHRVAKFLGVPFQYPKPTGRRPRYLATLHPDA